MPDSSELYSLKVLYRISNRQSEEWQCIKNESQLPWSSGRMLCKRDDHFKIQSLTFSIWQVKDFTRVYIESRFVHMGISLQYISLTIDELMIE